MTLLKESLSDTNLDFAARYWRDKVQNKPWLIAKLDALELFRSPWRLKRMIKKSLTNFSQGRSPQATSSVAFVGGRDRLLFKLTASDLAAHAALAKILAEKFEAFYGANVWSYRKGRSSLGAARELRRIAKIHCQGREKKQRGLYVLRRDVSRFGDSIALYDRAPLFQILKDNLARAHCEKTGESAKLILTALRLEVSGAYQENGAQCPDGFCPRIGLPTGSPLVPQILNLYLQPLDQKLSQIEGGFYIRFGDDIIFAHPDRKIAEATRDLIPLELAKLGVALNEKKSADIFWCGNAFTPPETKNSGWHGQDYVDYLGLRVGFSGQITLPTSKLRETFSDLRLRLRQIGHLRTYGLNDLGFHVALAELVGDLFNFDSSLSFAHSAALHFEVDDRKFLHAIDRRIQMEIARVMVPYKNPHPFRQFSPKWLRKNLHLPSLVHKRNSGRAREPQSA